MVTRMSSEKRCRIYTTALFLLIAAVFTGGCQACQKLREQFEGPKPEPKPKTVKPKPPVKVAEKKKKPPPMVQPVPFWENGKTEKMIDAASADLHGYLILDLGEEWTPYIFTDGLKPDGEPAPHAYRPIYLALARGEFPNDHHGERAKDDKYLELYGIIPTLELLRKRFRATAAKKCIQDLDLQPIIDYKDFVSYVTNEKAKKDAGDAAYLRRKVNEMMRRQKVTKPEAIDTSKLDTRAQNILARYQKVVPEYDAIRAVQKRLKCEGYFERKGRYVKGGLDWATHEALAEFERRHRVYGWGYFGADTLRVLRMTPLEAERDGLLRVLTERAMHAARVIEDGSVGTLKNGEPLTFLGIDGKKHPIPDLWTQLQEHIVNAFGLQTPESTLAWLESLGDLPDDKPLLVAIKSPEIPEYYDGNMDLFLTYDRGDVWYDFPYDDQGKERAQPVNRRPKITVWVKYNSQKIPLAKLGTTIGGWRSEKIGDHIMWKYKQSPVGWRVWQNIVAAPVWLPPDGTPPRDVLKRKRIRKAAEPPYEINYHETGPSYACAYGLVAAYHRKYFKKADGTIIIGGDEGVRTHGSVDYMSIMRRHSHGCHRLHNHLAVRLMSFILAHRPHKRLGHQPLSFSKVFEYEGVKYQMDIQQGGYIFELAQPLEVNVLEGRIKGKMKQPIDIPIPKYNPDAGAYIHPDAGPVIVRKGKLLPAPPPLDAGILPYPPNPGSGTTLPPRRTMPRPIIEYHNKPPTAPR
jgi:hypothetical protein